MATRYWPEMRPQTFEAVVGQEPITRTLQNALTAGRVAHAFRQRPPGRRQDLGGPHPGQGAQLRSRPHPAPGQHLQLCTEITNGSSWTSWKSDGAPTGASTSPGPEGEDQVSAGPEQVQGLHQSMKCTCSPRRLQRPVEDPGGAAGACGLYPGHHRAPQGAGDDPVALPALRFQADSPPG